MRNRWALLIQTRGEDMEFVTDLPEDMVWAIEQLRKDPAVIRG